MMNLKREKLLIVSNIAVITITLLVLGVFITVIAFSQTAIRTLEKQAQVTLFFKDEFGEQQIHELKARLEEDERISEIKYVSKEDALKIFQEINKNDPLLLESISASILPASLEIKTNEIEDLPVFAEELNEIDGVEEVKFFRDVIETFKSWSTLAYTIGLGLTILFIVITFSVIMITLRITINTKGEELEILKLVGASDSYVKRPLIKQNIIFGLISGLLASSILFIADLMIQFSGAYTGHIEFAFLPNYIISFMVFGISLSVLLTAIGLALGYFGSVLAIKKYLKY
jgi:cell division transport system permease protein